MGPGGALRGAQAPSACPKCSTRKPPNLMMRALALAQSLVHGAVHLAPRLNRRKSHWLERAAGGRLVGLMARGGQ
jgi:hypothetical protein